MFPKIKRVLNIEDLMSKHLAVARSLKNCGIEDIDHATSAMEGLTMISVAIEEENPYDLIVSDMYFPIFPGEREEQAGLYVIEELLRQKIEVPIIVCSSARLHLPEFENVVGCIFYQNYFGDLDGDMRKMLEKI